MNTDGVIFRVGLIKYLGKSGMGCPSPTVHSTIASTGVRTESGVTDEQLIITALPDDSNPDGACSMKTKLGGGTIVGKNEMSCCYLTSEPRPS